MRYWLAATIALAACDRSKDKEIAALKSQLVAKESGSATTNGTTPIEKTATPATTKESNAEAVFHRLDGAGNVSGDDLAAFLVRTDANQTITYEHLKKNAERYKGKEWAISGRVLEISEEGGETLARIGIDSYGNKAMFVIAKFETEFVQGKMVDVAGYLAGSFSYESQAGWKITVPSLYAVSIQRYGEFGRLRDAAKRVARGRVPSAAKPPKDETKALLDDILGRPKSEEQ